MGKQSKNKETLTEGIKSSLEALKKIGYNIKYDENVLKELTELSIELDNCCSGKKAEEAISKLEDVDYFAKQGALDYAAFLSMTDQEIAEEDQIRRKFRETLRSLVSK
jgi:hypothetical protein